VVIIFLGIFAGIAAPIFRQYGKAGIVLAGRAAMLVIVAVTGLLHQDMRDGLAT
jgi:cobalamin synthase